MNSFEELKAYYYSLTNPQLKQDLKELKDKARWNFQLPTTDDVIMKEFDIMAAIEAESVINKQRAEWLGIIKNAYITKDQETMEKFLPKYLGIENESN